MKIIFSHGKESGPQGSKIKYLSTIAAKLGCTVESIDYRESFDTRWRIKRLLAVLENEKDSFVLVGSSMGAYVANAAAIQKPPLGLFLMAPAFYLNNDEYADQDPAAAQCPITIVHGWHDDVVPLANTLRFAQKNKSILHVLDSDHGLNSSLTILGQLFELFLQEMIANDKYILK